MLSESQEHRGGSVAAASADTRSVSEAQPSCVRPGRGVQGDFRTPRSWMKPRVPSRASHPTPMCTRRSGRVVPRCSWSDVAASCCARYCPMRPAASPIACPSCSPCSHHCGCVVTGRRLQAPRRVYRRGDGQGTWSRGPGAGGSVSKADAQTRVSSPSRWSLWHNRPRGCRLGGDTRGVHGWHNHGRRYAIRRRTRAVGGPGMAGGAGNLYRTSGHGHADRSHLPGSRRVAGGASGDTRDERPLSGGVGFTAAVGRPGTILEALTPTLAAHPGMWPGMALYWLRRQAAS